MKQSNKSDKKNNQITVSIATTVMLFCAICICISNSYGQHYTYVSPNGKDTGNGTEKKPYRTLNKAIEADKKNVGETTIFLREGDYRLSETLVLDSSNGNDIKSLTIRSFPNEKAVIKGSIELKNLKWEPYRDGIMKTKAIISPIPDMLIVNGEIKHQARFPNFDSTAVRFNGTSADATSAERVKTWENPSGGFLHAMHAHDWGDFHYRITGKNEDGELKMEGGHQNNRQMGLHRSNRMVENIFEELDTVGEWFYNSAEQTLYYYPPENESINNSVFEIPVLKHLFEIKGTKNNPVKNIRIENVGMSQTVRTFMEKYEPLLRSDWTVYRGGAVLFENATDCSITDCDIWNVGGNAVFFSNYCRRCEVAGTHFFNIGASAILFVGDHDAVRSPSFEYGKYVEPENIDRQWGAKNDNYPMECSARNNLINHIGLFEKQITGIEISMSKRITVSYCSIYDTPRAGINISEGTWGGHILEFNDVFNTVKETGDHGSFNSWGRDRYWRTDCRLVDTLVATAGYDTLILADATETNIIRNNRFRCDRGWDIDLDDGSSNYHIYNNLCLNGGLKLREGYYRTVENNILLNSGLHRHVWYENSGIVFARNILLTRYPDPVGSHFSVPTLDYNIFADSASLLSAQQTGTDKNSIAAEIRFVNPETGDYRISNECTEIFRLGFQNFPMNKFGVQSPRLKQIAEKPEFTKLFQTKKSKTSETIEWRSIKIKNLETLGERSATGMDSERGILVVYAGTNESRSKEWFRQNDVILKFNGVPVNNIDELKKAEAAANASASVIISVFRGQKEIEIPVN